MRGYFELVWVAKVTIKIRGLGGIYLDLKGQVQEDGAFVMRSFTMCTL
jgi:hypothetical protein